MRGSILGSVFLCQKVFVVKNSRLTKYLVGIPYTRFAYENLEKEGIKRETVYSGDIGFFYWPCVCLLDESICSCLFYRELY